MLFMTSIANAAEFDVYCDNQNRKIIFNITDAGEKPLIVYVADADGNIIAIGDTVVNGTNHEAILNIPSDIQTEQYYTAVIEDYMAVNDIEGITYENRSKDIFISDADLVSEILSDMSNKNGNELAASIELYYRELDLDIANDYTSSCIDAFSIIRGDKKYTQFSDIKNDFIKAKAVGFFTDSSASVLKERADIYNKDLEMEFDSDYQECKDEVWRVFTHVREKINGMSDVENVVKKWFEESKAIAVINTSSREEMDNVINSYGEILGMDIDKYNQIRNESDKMTVIKALQGKEFDNVKQVNTAFDNAITSLNDNKNSSGGGSSSGSLPGGSSSTLPYVGTPVNNPSDDEENVPDSIEDENQNGNFSDIDNSHWAYDAIMSLYTEGIISGYNDNTVRPDASVTRAEFVKMITVAAKQYASDAVCSFNDISSDDWYYSYVASAVNEGIVMGYADNTFKPNDLLTRQDAVLMLYRITGDMDDVQDVVFTDERDISDYALDAVLTLSKAGMINGFENGEFRPHENITRAQVSQIIYNIMEGGII